MIALLLLALGAGAGLLGALMGIGGGILVIPALTEVLGVPFAQAAAVSLVVIIASASASSAAYVERGTVDLRVGVVLELASVSGSLAGSAIAASVPVRALQVVFASVALYSALMLWRRRRSATDVQQAGEYAVRRWGAGLSVSAIAGAVSGLVGVGGGVFKMPVMTLAMGMPFKVAAATSNFMIGVTAAAGAYVYYARGALDVRLAAPVVVGVFAGARLGVVLLPRLPARRLQAAFAWILVVLGLRMIWTALAGRGP